MKERIVSSRNKLKEYFLKNDYDYLLSLEQDVVSPKDVIERLMKHDKDICSGLYFNHGGIKNSRSHLAGHKALPNKLVKF